MTLRYIDLVEGNRPIGRFDVPEEVRSPEGRVFHLDGAAKTGGNSVVFEAREFGTRDFAGQPRAIKFLKQMTQQRIDRFHNEIRVLRELNSPYISSYFSSGATRVTAPGPGGEAREIPWVAIQMGGLNMRQHVDANGPLSLPQLKSITFGICAALEHVHEKGFIHRDVKPENFVWRSAGSTAPMMIDFGIAKRQGEDVSGRPMDTFTRVTEFVGPVLFSSPELIEYSKDKSHPVDYRSDIFQLGKVFWYLGTGKISAGVPSRKECPANGRLRDLILGMIDDDPECRPQSLAEIRDAMNAV